jgi:hypothetical protein
VIDSALRYQRWFSPTGVKIYCHCGVGTGKLLTAFVNYRYGGRDYSSKNPYQYPSRLRWLEIEVMEFDINSFFSQEKSLISPIARYPNLISPVQALSPVAAGYLSNMSPCIVWIDNKNDMYCATLEKGAWDIGFITQVPPPHENDFSNYAFFFKDKDTIELFLSHDEGKVLRILYDYNTKEVFKEEVWSTSGKIEWMSALSSSPTEVELAMVVDKGEKGQCLYLIYKTSSGWQSELVDKSMRIGKPCMAVDDEKKIWIMYERRALKNTRVYDVIAKVRNSVLQK